jgi:hypothetical protein
VTLLPGEKRLASRCTLLGKRIMNEEGIARYIIGSFQNIQVESADGSVFFFLGTERNFPMVTLVTKDSYDQFSQLNRPSVFRLNIGITRDTFRSLFAAPASPPGDARETADRAYDFTALDQIMPHPVYGQMFWVCVLNPSVATFEKVKPLLAEAYDSAVKRQAKREGE